MEKNTQAATDDRVSVVMPVYNAESYLNATIESILAQTHPVFEIIAVDDGSTDSSLTILEQYGDRIAVIKQQNKGPAAARNRGAQAAGGRWIAFCDADDLWLPQKLERQLQASRGYRWSYTDAAFLGGTNDGRRDSELTRKHSGDIFDNLVVGNFLGTSCLMIDRDVFIGLGGFDESLRSIQDWELWTRIARKHPIAYVDEPLARYRVHATSTSRKTRSTLPNHLRVIDKIFDQVDPETPTAKLKAAAKAQSYGICGQIAEEEGDYPFSVRCAVSACLLEPSSLSRWVTALKSLVKYLLFILHIRR